MTIHDEERVRERRVTRPEQERETPVRSFSKLVDAEPAAENSAADFRDVGVGYRVLEDYLRQGARVARSFDGHGPSDGPSGVEPLLERITRATSDFGAVWLEVVRALLASSAERPLSAPGRDPGPFRMPEAPAPAVEHTPSPPSPRVEGPRVESARSTPPDGLKLCVRAASAVEVSFRWLQERVEEPLVAHELRGPADAGNIPSPGARLDEDGLVLSLVVPPLQPSGLYSGLIVNEHSNLPQAMVVVRVLVDAAS